MTRAKDLTGLSFGRLTAIRRHGTDQRGAALWLCSCSCGTKNKIVAARALRSGITRSCGCGRYRGPDAFRVLGEGAPACYGVFDQYKRHAKNRGVPWLITDGAFLELTQERCYYCGAAPSNHKQVRSGSNFTYNGIDRVDSSRGYETGNVVPCCAVCNRAKSDMTQEEFITWVHRVASLNGVPA